MSPVAQSLHRTSIPLDICFQVIDYVDYEFPIMYRRPTLGACALACSAWLPRARRHLYRSVWLSEPEEYKLFARTIAGSPSLGALVKELRCDVDMDDEVWDDAAVADALLPNRAARNLTGLRYLGIMSNYHICVHPGVFKFVSNCARAKSVTTLAISEFLTLSPEDIIHMLKHFPHIQEFCLDTQISLDEFGAHALTDLPPDFCRNLTKLTLADLQVDAPYLAVMPDHITTLQLGRYYPLRGPEDPEDTHVFKLLQSVAAD
ncbi:hypothetical protein GY45DRAFT_1152499 [Cubamyces sp. BRFM 1775]|nr:hypothetical protein GY45DRAFT_1152499 [Cubamyces sp. BRFM 1775]